ncbi:MAG: hypothetical protein JWO80_2403 [Bryobacterales bacterium]|nr:hypothetical protein [Bryobacterales bacterium]
MSLKQTYYQVTDMDGYDSCRYAVYIDPTLAASLTPGTPKNVDAVFAPVRSVQTEPPFPVNIANILYIPAKSSGLDTLAANSLFREAHLSDTIPSAPKAVVSVTFDSASPNKAFPVSLTSDPGTFQVSLHANQDGKKNA